MSAALLMAAGPGLAMACEQSLRKAKVAKAIELLSGHEQIQMPVTHHLTPGIYVREIFMPAGAYVIGHVHKTRHQNIILSGRAVVQQGDQDFEVFEMGTMFVSGVGVQKVLHILEDCRWLTVHPNPDDCTDIATLELRIVDVPAQFIEMKGGLTLDEYRMSMNTHSLTKGSEALQ